jgi:hypothetical protein
MIMNITNALVTAATAGILLGLTGCSKDPVPQDPSKAQSSEVAAPKHACKGQNACKGQGGCKVEGQHACKGHNACKGQGGCKTA